MISTIRRLFIILRHPLSLVLLLVGLTMFVILTLLSLLNLRWLAIIIFLIFMGGLLVIFTYLSALVPNEVYFLNIVWILLIINPLFTLKFWESKPLSNQNTTLSSIIRLNETSRIYFFLLYLLLALIVTIILSQKIKNPLNQNRY